ncbi:MAG: bifunctional helix-turn-helix domain-containing protein/methylated-DNA--[protein]-cysteine S-methyltransferase [Deltaproteobacteria bacterium]|jgi:AraC family transcriptional regulator of adaptative response/methylated-DNA-[protein]-cysteine methyltransferase|nr:bifunctional helix-turn-helix domain-containing protein/methylated-DNA--[protein]-cysteine S-methyltransferase [Deltaproteobacteria bacterium]
MKTEALLQANEDYERIEKSIKFLESNFPSQPGLKEVAAHIGLSEFHFQRLFSRWVGISPKRFLQFLTKEYAKKLLESDTNLLDVTYEAGLTSPSRLHDLFVTCEAVTPGEFKTKGEGVAITYGFHPSPFGKCLLAITGRGICGLYFVKNGNQRDVFAEFKQYWQKAALIEDPSATGPLIPLIFNPSLGKKREPLHLILKGTNFQIKVWEALTKIPFGMVVTYEDVAMQVGIPKATRAVGTAVGHNPISYIIPCHRVIRKNAEFGNYGSGPARKKAILGWEAARVNLHP